MHILKDGQTVQTVTSRMPCTAEKFLGGGGQGEVYRADLGGQKVALKWYFPAQATPEQRVALETLIKKGPPTDKFLWPMELTQSDAVTGFGYIMPLRGPQYKSIVDLMKRRVEPTFRALATAGLELADSFLDLHAMGLCYRDISFGNVFFEPNTGEALICDNDNVAVDGETESGVLGTPRFMAPEIVRGEARPSMQTDLFSLAVLLFYMLMVHHPLEGRKESEIKCLDLPAMNKLYGFEPIFIFDPKDDTNRPMPGYHDNALAFWPLYPQFVRDLFVKAFTDGIHDPQARVRESEWRAAMVQLRDAIIYCPHCGVENFYDCRAPQGIRRPSGNVLVVQRRPRPPAAHPHRRRHSDAELGHQTLPASHRSGQAVRLHHAGRRTGPASPRSQHLGAEKHRPREMGHHHRHRRHQGRRTGRSTRLTAGVKVNFGKLEGEIRA